MYTTEQEVLWWNTYSTTLMKLYFANRASNVRVSNERDLSRAALAIEYRETGSEYTEKRLPNIEKLASSIEKQNLSSQENFWAVLEIEVII